MKVKQNLNAGAVELQPGTLCVDNSRGATRNVCYDLSFRFVFNYIYVAERGYWEVDIVRLPPFDDEVVPDLDFMHTAPSARGGEKIRVPNGEEPRTERAAKKLSMKWAEALTAFILSGVTPDEQKKVNNERTGFCIRHYD